MIQLDQVYKKHGTTEAVVNVSIHVNKGESLAFVGRSGSGKTSLLRLIAGLDTPDSGRVHCRGNIGMVFQSLALWPHATVYQQLEMVLHASRWDSNSKQERIFQMMELFGIAAWKNRKPSLLSGGEQQRVALARAFAPDPEILLLDEPLAHLDSESRLELQPKLVKEMKDKVVVIAMHEPEDAKPLVQRIVRISRGKLE